MKNMRNAISYKKVLFTAASIVVFVTVYSLILPGITMERTAFCGMEEHEHSDACYEITETVVCGQEEFEGHEHTEECFTAEQVLVCELEENEDHAHTDECYETENILTCGRQEMPGHIHTEECFLQHLELICGLEEHIHTEECFADPEAETEMETEETTEETMEETMESEIAAEEENGTEETSETTESEMAEEESSAEETAESTEETAEEETSVEEGAAEESSIEETAESMEETAVEETTEAAACAQMLTAEGNGFHITVTCSENAGIPEGAELLVKEIKNNTADYEGYISDTEKTLDVEEGNISYARFFDITIVDPMGWEIQPAEPVQVMITLDDLAENVEEEKAPQVVHFGDETEEIREVALTTEKTAAEAKKDAEAAPDSVSFEANGFSVYGVVGTVVDTADLKDGQQYVIYTGSNNQYYAMTHYSEGRDKDKVYGAQIDASAIAGTTFTEEDYGSSIVWTAHKVNGGNYTFSYEEGGKTYYLRTYGGLMVGADSDINESGYREAKRYQWTVDSQGRMRAANTTDNNRRLRYSAADGAFRERDNNASSGFIFAEVSSYSQDTMIHYVDENGNPLEVINGRNWDDDNTTSPAFLIYDIEGYDYVRSALGSVNGTEIRPILRTQDGRWQYTTSVNKSTVEWKSVNQEIYVVYKKSEEPVTGGTPKVKESGATENPADPAIRKDSVPNGDGTNTISLSITADTSPLEVEKLADVIVIFDVSTSMRREMTNGTQYNNNDTAAKNCNHRTRLWIAHNAVKDLANTLIGDNTEFQDSTGNKLIRMSLIAFSDKASLVQGFTDNYGAYASAVEGLKTNTGTNWEDALRMANHMAVDPERATFVIFVTDGNPSYRATRGNLLNMDGYPDTVNDSNIDIYTDSTWYMYRANTIQGGLNENDERNYNTTLDVARSIADHNKNYYAIGVGPASGVSRLQGLTTYAYDGDSLKGEDRTKNAKDSDELTAAFSDITASIIAMLGWGDIVMTDGITSLTNTVAKSGLTNVDGDFAYFKAEAPKDWNHWSKNVRAGYILGTSGKALAYPDNYNTWTVDDQNGFVAAYNKGKSLNTSDFESWNPASENCSKAVYDKAAGSVKWDMGHKFVPEAGCTYRVSFRAWPSQEAYDILAKCENDPGYYDTLTADQKAQIIRSASAPYTYTIKTNDKDPRTTYKAARKTGDGVQTTGSEQTLKFNEVDPLGLASEIINVKKEWNNALNDDREPAPVKLGVRAAGMDNAETDNVDESIFAVMDVSAETSWGGSSNISTGLMKVENGTQTIYEHGHDFTLTEDVDPSARYHWELEADTYRPMVITDSANGFDTPTAVMLKKVSSSEDYDYVIDDGYYAIQSGTAALTATNHRRSNLNLVKQVIDNAGNTISSGQLFEFSIRIDDPTINGATDGQDIWFSVQTDPNDTATVVKDLNVDGAEPEFKDGERTGFFHVHDNTDFTVKIQPGWNLRVINLPSKTKYIITESAAAGYTFDSAAADQGTFTLTEGTTTGNGTIDEANTQYTVTYKNRTETKNVSIWKTDLDHAAITTGAEFALYSAENYDDAAEKAADGAKPLVTGTTGSDAILTLGAIPVGEYRLVETRAPKGYNPAASAIRITVEANGVTAIQGTGMAEVAQDSEENPYHQYWVAGQESGTYQIRVWNNPGVELPNTGGMGTTGLYLIGALMAAFAGIALWVRVRIRCI